MKMILMWLSFTNGVPYWRKITTLLKTDDNSVLRPWMKLCARKLTALILSMHACKLSRFSRVRLCATLWTAAHQALLSMGFFRQEYWSGLPFPSPSNVYYYSIISYSIRKLIIKPFLEWQELATNRLWVAAGLPEPQQRIQDGGDSPSVQAAEPQSPVGNLPEFYHCILAAHLMLTVIEVSFHWRKVKPVGFFRLWGYLDLNRGGKKKSPGNLTFHPNSAFS